MAGTVCVVASLAPGMTNAIQKLAKQQDLLSVAEIRLDDIFRTITGQTVEAAKGLTGGQAKEKVRIAIVEHEHALRQIAIALAKYEIRKVILVGKKGNEQEATAALFAAAGLIKERFSVSILIFWDNNGKIERVRL